MCLALLPSAGALAAADSLIQLKQTKDNIILTTGISYLEDKKDSLDLKGAIQSNSWQASKAGILNFGVTKSTYWVRILLQNNTAETKWILKVAQPILDEVHFIDADSGKIISERITGEEHPFSTRLFNSTDYLFPLDFSSHSYKSIYIKIKNSDNLQVPVIVGTQENILQSDKYKDIFWGTLIGLFGAMLLYNFFIYLSVRDKSYLWYVAYLIAVLLTQTSIQGYTTYLWPSNQWLTMHMALLSPALVGIMGMYFMRYFLHSAEKLPGTKVWFHAINCGYLVSVLLVFLGQIQIAFTLTEISATAVAIFMLYVSITLSRRGYRPAVFFLISWIVFLLGIMYYTFKDFNILPYNTFAVYTMPIGAMLEVLLLSFALADRINILKAETLFASQENERIIREQNVMLETKVEERTLELRASQSQLVESEKMASLGQLTAGIAHEINNPINFVIANVNPLKRDINLLKDTLAEIELLATDNDSLKGVREKIAEIKEDVEYDYLIEEIDRLLIGISEGSERTAEIVKGLRIFARVDEDDLKKANIHEGIDSTTIIVNTLLNNKVIIQKDYGELPYIECYPGKLNQVFLNIITNGIHAITERFGSKPGGIISIKTRQVGNNAVITLGDNGTGMPEDVIHKIFEPFYTTKQVGEGTGLGLSIASSIIKKHNGTINVKSEQGVGTEFIIEIPMMQA